MILSFAWKNRIFSSSSWPLYRKFHGMKNTKVKTENEVGTSTLFNERFFHFSDSTEIGLGVQKEWRQTGALQSMWGQTRVRERLCSRTSGLSCGWARVGEKLGHSVGRGGRQGLLGEKKASITAGNKTTGWEDASAVKTTRAGPRFETQDPQVAHNCPELQFYRI